MMNPKFWEIVHYEDFSIESVEAPLHVNAFNFRKITQDEFERLEENIATEWRFCNEDLFNYGLIHFFYPKARYLRYARDRNIIKA